MEAAPLNPSDFLLVQGMYGIRPAFPFPMGSEGVGRVAKTGSKVDAALQGKRVLIVPTYEQGTWADQVVVPVRNIVPMSDEADPLQLSMIGINPVTAYLLLNRYERFTRSWATSQLMDRSPPQWSMSTRSTSSRKRSINL